MAARTARRAVISSPEAVRTATALPLRTTTCRTPSPHRTSPPRSLSRRTSAAVSCPAPPSATGQPY